LLLLLSEKPTLIIADAAAGKDEEAVEVVAGDEDE
jgi:hypothetical protein